MRTSPDRRRLLQPLMFSVLILAACSDQAPEALLGSARDYLAHDDAKAAIIQIKNALQKNPDLPEARFLLGKAFLENGDGPAAELELRKARDMKYASDQVLPLLAKSLLVQGKLDKLQEEFASADAGTAESRADLQTTLGIARALAGDFKEAQAVLGRALEAKPDYAPALIAQARLKAGGRDFAGAQSVVDGVLSREPANREAWKLKGDLQSIQGQAEAALVSYRKALELSPGFVAAHAAIISTLMRQGHSEEAGRQLEAMKKVARKDAQTLYLETLFAWQKKDLKAARELAQQLLQFAPYSADALQLAGAVEYQSRRWTQAEDYLARAAQLAPDRALPRRLLVATHLGSGQPGKALAALQPALENIDKDPAMLALAGQVYLQNGDVHKAERYFTKAAALDPTDARKRTSLALTHMLGGDVDGAFGELEEISAADSGTVADLALIASHLENNNLAKALQAIAGLEKKQPDNPLVHDLRARTLAASGDRAGARRSFEQALAVDPRYFPAISALAALDMADRKPDDARRRFEALLSNDPKNVQALLALAELRRQAGGSPQEVAALLSKAVAAGPGASAPRLALVEHYLRNKDAARAVAVAQEAAAALTDRPEILDALGVALQTAGNTNQALATYGKLANLQPSSPQPHLRMADIHLAAKNPGEAQESLKRALDIKPDLGDAQRRLVYIHLEAGRTAEALEVARQAQRRNPGSAAGFVLEGDIEAAGRHWAQAAAAYRAALKLSAGAEVAVKLHTALAEQGAAAEADRFAAAWTKDHPRDIVLRAYLGERAIGRNDYDTAARHFRAALENQPDNGLLLNNLAWVAGRQKSPQAIEYAEKANRVVPNQPAFMDTLAMLLVEKGETGRALELLRKAVDLAPGAHEIRLNYARVLLQSGDRPAARRELETLNRLGDKFPRQAEIAELMKQV